ncbi:uncharacterized protein LOC119745182 [Patiria miniata]|uniref:Integrase catalytic domain-containing protein n=1 Tax=Patiria miniata TaxID=46514 RepID=A0A914BMJ2_PATMI|nr:uncharacterized protein LOC119745182 [Patiria miniata]
MGVLLRFRQEEIAIMGDIATMFFQVRVPGEDRDCLRFFWWPNANLKEQPVAYRLKVHPFGAVSSPSCSSFALKQTVEDNVGDYGEASCDIVKRSFYVDDCLVSVGTEQEAAHLIQSTTALCKQGGFHLTKWVSNSHQVLQTVPIEERAKDIRELSMENQNLPNERALGSLCRRDIGWDEEIQGEDLRIWNQWLSEVKDLDQLRTRRCYKPSGFGQVVSCQLHIFADASDVGYGVAAYLRLCDESGRISCSLVTGKARVAPLKKMTIPRMELTAATIAVRLGKVLTQELDCDIHGTYYWTDSMTVLRYLANDSSRFQTFVANRIAIIRDASCLQQWKYVNTKFNPADCATRGQSVKRFLQCSMWFEGPVFLSQPETEWPQQDADLTKLPDNDAEVKKTVLMTAETPISPVDRLLEHYSDWTRLKRAVAWILVVMKHLQDRVAASKRLKQEPAQQELEQQEPNALHRSQKLESEQRRVRQTFSSGARESLNHTRLTTEDLEAAERVLVYHVQQKHWKDEIKLLNETEGKPSSVVKKSSSLRKLDPKLVDGLLRVGGRIGRADLDFESKHQVLMPRDSPVSRLILQHIHKSVGHLGKNSILAELRRHYWIIGAPSIIKGIVSRCVTCRRYQAPAEQQKMASLPLERLALNEPPFSKVGMDYFGPFEVKRGRSMVKRYGVIFTCLTSRAVHLELAHSLDTDSCINAIRRFSARRGSLKSILSDNGTNLVGAEREMREQMRTWNQQKIHDNLLQKGISWQFNPPAGSHFGGIWERLIRSVRKILYSLMREQNVHLSDEALQTLLCEVEAVMNGRPLTECPNSPNDLDVLTPNHLLLQRSGESLPPGLFDEHDKYPVKQWRQVQYFADIFWNRWSKEYLPLLQERQN